MQNIHDILQKYWGYTQFRPLQEEIIKTVLEGKDVLTLMPTGGGKSICFQVPAMVQEGLCLVISPLIALMQDQVEKLKARGIDAMCIFSGMKKKELEQALEKCVYGKIKLLYLSPERLQTELFLTRLQQMKVRLLVVDEAHCISTWGEDFRPAYRQIVAIKKLLPGINTLALTATATPQVRKDIELQLGLKDVAVFEQSFIRENLVYVVRKSSDVSAQLVHLLRSVAGSTLVYADTRSATKKIADDLQKKGIKATYYHAGLEIGVRTAHQKAWVTGEMRVMVATNAFGMGIDKPDVRMVIHIHLPESIEAYYQESGRAGRDGKKAYAVMLYNDDSIETLYERLQSAHPRMQTIKKVYQCLANYYQIAIGSHHMVSYELDTEDFALSYQLTQHTVLQAIRQLEKAGLVQYNDQFFRPAKVRITASPKALYTYQMTAPHHEKMIQTLIYSYGDRLFHEGSMISTKTIATRLHCHTEVVNKELQELDTLGILDYTPQQHHAQVTFITPRYAVEHLPISTKRIEERKKQAVIKAEAMIDYVRHEHCCRTQILVAYFGQVSYVACGKCDICLNKKLPPLYIEQALDRYRPQILNRINEGKSSVYHIIQAINPERATVLTKVINTMINKGELVYDKSLQLVRSK